MIKKKVTAILLSTVMIISTLAFSQTTAKASVQNGWEQGQWTWYYYINGNKATGWNWINNKWYYFNETGAMATEWTFIDSDWYYFESNGAMATGWKFTDHSIDRSNKYWRYLKSNGAMAKGWINDGGKTYYLNDISGSLEVNTITPDGYVVGPDGTWDGQAKKQRDLTKGIRPLGELRKKILGEKYAIANQGGIRKPEYMEKYDSSDLMLMGVGTGFMWDNDDKIVQPDIMINGKLAYSVVEMQPRVYYGGGRDRIKWCLGIDGKGIDFEEIRKAINSNSLVQIKPGNGIALNVYLCNGRDINLD